MKLNQNQSLPDEMTPVNSPPTPPQPNLTHSLSPTLPQQKSPLRLIFGTLFILALAAAGYFYYQTTLLQSQLATTQPIAETQVTTPPQVDPTADWQTYQNDQYSFLIKLPNTWQKQSRPSQDPTFIIDRFETDLIPDSRDDKTIMTITYHQNIANLETWLQENQAGTIIGSTESRFIIVRGGTLLPSQEYMMRGENNSYIRIFFEPFPQPENSLKQYQEFVKVIDQILSTFEFID